MTEPKKCIVCGVGPREVPDRNVMGRLVHKVCRQCHRKRLLGDLDRIIRTNRQRKPGE